MAEVSMSTYVCRWCGAPYSVPTEVSNNSMVTKRCPSGHRYADGQTVEQELENVRRYLTEAKEEIRRRDVIIANLKGQVAKLKTTKQKDRV